MSSTYNADTAIRKIHRCSSSSLGAENKVTVSTSVNSRRCGKGTVLYIDSGIGAIWYVLCVTLSLLAVGVATFMIIKNKKFVKNSL